MDEKKYAVVTTTCANDEEAGKIAAVLLEKRLAACVQMQPISSNFIWKGELCNEKEILLLIKCRADHYDAIEQEILKNHSYEVPEILLLPVAGGYREYLDWIDSA